MKGDVLDSWIDRVGMAAIVLVSLGYVLFGASFAQLRLEFSFLNFPIFIGEVLLGFSFLLFIFKREWQKQEIGPWGWILAAYLVFILIKAFCGYRVWGPFAFRDAALFYYPFFIVFGYSFWSPEVWSGNTRRLIIAVILSIFILQQFVTFWPCSLIIIGVILALKTKNFWERMILAALIMLLAPYGVLFNTFLRTVLLSSLITVNFIGVMIFLLFCRDRQARILGLVLGGLMLGIVLFKLCQTDMGKTFVIKDAQSSVAAMPDEKPQTRYLFHPVGGSSDKPDAIKEFLKKIRQGDIYLTKKNFLEKRSAIGDNQGTLMLKKEDTLFRYYIWRDMFIEYARYKPLFGFDFGRALFSPTIAKYYWSTTSQNTDGWLGAHNSFLYMIYRAGIVGLAMVLFIFILWIGLLRDFYILKDWTGVLLCALFLNWIISANFFLIFELPYTAIPVWTILGVTIKHRMLLKKALN